MAPPACRRRRQLGATMHGIPPSSPIPATHLPPLPLLQTQITSKAPMAARVLLLLAAALLAGERPLPPPPATWLRALAHGAWLSPLLGALAPACRMACL